MVQKKELSLLPESENPTSLIARITNWLTSVGRFVIVFTELFVILAFISRFWLDRKNSDLSEIIRQRRAILESTQPFEKDYQLLQNRLSFIKKFYLLQPDYSSSLSSLVESTPPDILFNKLSINSDPVTKVLSAKLALNAYQESSIVDFITNLSLNPNIDKVNIDSIEKKAKEIKYTISVTLQFKKA
ncbi:hypothetical protein KBC75_00110 [Candidatus Shapirobacteria bacterium]|nr:hypothetical protein [Candidatus Shapirobacteria bacterium]